jgi:hypothetical protein
LVVVAFLELEVLLELEILLELVVVSLEMVVVVIRRINLIGVKSSVEEIATIASRQMQIVEHV